MDCHMKSCLVCLIFPIDHLLDGGHSLSSGAGDLHTYNQRSEDTRETPPYSRMEEGVAILERGGRERALPTYTDRSYHDGNKKYKCISVHQLVQIHSAGCKDFFRWCI